MNEFANGYRDPRWQQKRLKIFERDGWKCLRCGSGDRELHAHHRYYEQGRAVWDYPEDAFASLCDPCHKEIESMIVWIRAMAHRDPYILNCCWVIRIMWGLSRLRQFFISQWPMIHCAALFSRAENNGLALSVEGGELLIRSEEGSPTDCNDRELLRDIDDSKHELVAFIQFK